MESRRFFPLGNEYFERDTFNKINKGHGRFESRTIESVEHKFSDWPEVKQIFHIVREREYREKSSQEHVYGITSLSKKDACAKELLKLNRNHWHIENKLHHVRDMTFREDQSRIRHHAKAQIMCAVRNTAITLISLAKFSNAMEAIEIFGEQREKALQLVRGRTE